MEAGLDADFKVAACPREPYDVSERVGFDGILSSQRDAAEDDEDEDEVGEVGVVNEVVAGNSQTEE